MSNNARMVHSAPSYLKFGRYLDFKRKKESWTKWWPFVKSRRAIKFPGCMSGVNTHLVWWQGETCEGSEDCVDASPACTCNKTQDKDTDRHFLLQKLCVCYGDQISSPYYSEVGHLFSIFFLCCKKQRYLVFPFLFLSFFFF